MTEQDAQRHYVRKWYEALFLIERHYIPMGKPWPEHYNAMLDIIIKALENGDIPEFGDEPILEKEVKQLDIFTHMQPTEAVSDNRGELFDSLTTITEIENRSGLDFFWELDDEDEQDD